MTKALFALMLASVCFVGCSERGSSKSGPTGQAVESAAPLSAETTPATGTTTGQAAASAESQPKEATPDAFETGAFAGPPPMAAPTMREVTIPAGTTLSVTVLNSLASDTSKVEDAVRGSLAKPVLVAGTTALPQGTPITGSVVEVTASGRVQGRASITFRFDHLMVNDEPVDIHTARVMREAAADTKSDVKKGGIGAGVGALVGGVVGGGKGAAVGAVAGGAGAVLATKGGEVDVPAGSVIEVLLQDPLPVTVPGH